MSLSLINLVDSILWVASPARDSQYNRELGSLPTFIVSCHLYVKNTLYVPSN